MAAQQVHKKLDVSTCYPPNQYIYFPCELKLCHLFTGTCEVLPGVPSCGNNGTPADETKPEPEEPKPVKPLPLPTTTPAPKPLPLPLPEKKPEEEKHVEPKPHTEGLDWVGNTMPDYPVTVPDMDKAKMTQKCLAKCAERNEKYCALNPKKCLGGG